MNVHLPATLGEALALKAATPTARLLLGGTDLLAQWQTGAGRPADVIALEHLPELRRIERDDRGVVIGGGVSHFALAHDAHIRRDWPALAEAARTVGAPAIQAMGTVAGNLGNASPAADLPPALLVYDAEVEVASLRGRRLVPCAWFFTAYRRIDLAPDEIIVSVRVPLPPSPSHATYIKVGTRAAQSIARVGLAAAVHWEAGRVRRARFAAAAVAAVPMRLVSAEQMVEGEAIDAALADRAADAAAASVTPIDDVRGSAAYRRHALGALLARFLREAGRRIEAAPA